MESIANVVLNHTKPITRYYISDVHADNPKCDLDFFLKVLKMVQEDEAKARLNGDTFCVMQGKGDPRHSKDGLRPEHVGKDYFNLVTDWMYELFKPYAKNLEFFGYGNHETAIIKNREVDILKLLVSRLNMLDGVDIKLGGYGGWIVDAFNLKGHRTSFNTKYHHGNGGGGAVTKNTIQHHRLQNYVHGADMIWTGHVHELWYMPTTIETFSRLGAATKNELRLVHHLQTSTFKEEFADGGYGYHIENGRPPKTLGCAKVTLTPTYYKERYYTECLVTLIPKQITI